MRFLFQILGLSAAMCSPCALAADISVSKDQLTLTTQTTMVDLRSGIVSRKGEEGLCLENVAQAGPHRMVVRRDPGDDVPKVTVNGIRQDWIEAASGRARMRALRLSRDGSVAVLRSWKTGAKQTEFLQDGQIVNSWKRDSSVKLLRYTSDAVLFLEKRAGKTWHLNRYMRNADGQTVSEAETLVDFGVCQPGKLRFAGDVLWAQLNCGKSGGQGIYKIDLNTGVVGQPLIVSHSAGFTNLPKSFGLSGGQKVMDVSGTPAAVRFFFAASGLLLSQTGEVRACSSDAEGLQSWNQSYRLRALSELFEKTSAEVFAHLALKSMRLTLASKDVPQDLTDAERSDCGWSSTIYSGNPSERLSLMINQAMIANALTRSCKTLANLCPAAVAEQIAETNSCLARTYEGDFDAESGLYRINGEINFRFAGKFAPWNWQIAFANVLKSVPEPGRQERAEKIIQAFLAEWQQDEHGGLWRYWPKDFYLENGLSQEQLSAQRFEDTGHAGITLLNLSDFASGSADEIAEAVKKRLDFLLAFDLETPRDLDGTGPKADRWFPASGWSHYATEKFRDVYSAPVPGQTTADTLYAYAHLFDASDKFELTIDFYSCEDICTKERALSYESLRSFLDDNPFFRVSKSPHDALEPRKQEIQ